jgi:hypothetical protein
MERDIDREDLGSFNANPLYKKHMPFNYNKHKVFSNYTFEENNINTHHDN